MKQFASRAVREVLFGVAVGCFAAIVIRFVVGLSINSWRSIELRLPVTTAISIVRDRDFEMLCLIITLCLFLLFASQIGSLLLKVARSWSVGLFTGIFPVWFILALLFFVPRGGWSIGRFLAFASTGIVFVIASRAIVSIRLRDRTASPIVIPEPSQTGTTIEPGFKFDLPIQAWSEDRLKRGTIVRGMAEQILRDKAPVLAVLGTFGEGKTSTLNLLAASLANRSDVILVRFSSWLPSNPQTLALSLFGTISKQIKSRYLIFGLNESLRKFARLLAGTIPRFGDNLRQILEPPSQMEQLDNLKKLLGELKSRVVVLVDEMDRLDRAELFVLLKAIRGVVDLPNMTYVCAFDKAAVARLISRKDLAYGEFYLEKFFPIKVSLPAVDELLLGAVFDHEIDGICESFGLLRDEKDKKAFSEETLPLWHTSIKHILTNFRRMTLLFNALRAALAPVYTEVNLFDMMVLQLVRLISEDTYNFIWCHGPVFYYPAWRVDLWVERLSVDDKKEADIRKQTLDAFFKTLSFPIRDQIIDLLRQIFPTVNDSLEDRRNSQRGLGEEAADQKKRIYHPDYFARYFIHQVQANLFGKREMSAFIDDLNAENILDVASLSFVG
jgi:predicted KAP-like P-loop ATPase